MRAGLTRTAAALLGSATGLLIADYGYTATNAKEVESLRRRARGHAFPIIIDSRYDLLTYKDLTAATPNEPEIEAAFGQSIGHDLEQLHTLGRKFLRRQGLQALLVTRGRDGMALFEPGRPPRHIPIFGSDQAVDVTGAGDTVIAAFTLALAAGASFLRGSPDCQLCWRDRGHEARHRHGLSRRNHGGPSQRMSAILVPREEVRTLGDRLRRRKPPHRLCQWLL